MKPVSTERPAAIEVVGVRVAAVALGFDVRRARRGGARRP